jgi:HK97 gp10 family phage protein
VIRMTASATNRFGVYIGKIQDAAHTAPQEAAESLRDDWAAHVPVDTGRLRDSIQMAPQGRGVRVSTDTPYAVYVEWGTSKMPARPAYRPAVERARRAYPELVRRKLQP